MGTEVALFMIIGNNLSRHLSCPRGIIELAREMRDFYRLRACIFSYLLIWGGGRGIICLEHFVFYNKMLFSCIFKTKYFSTYRDFLIFRKILLLKKLNFHICFEEFFTGKYISWKAMIFRKIHLFRVFHYIAFSGKKILPSFPKSRIFRKIES